MCSVRKSICRKIRLSAGNIPCVELEKTLKRVIVRSLGFRFRIVFRCGCAVAGIGAAEKKRRTHCRSEVHDVAERQNQDTGDRR